MAIEENKALVRRFYEEVRDGKVAEIWNHRDDLGLAQQLGAAVYAGAPPQGD
jgi:hypothetical protein